MTEVERPVLALRDLTAEMRISGVDVRLLDRVSFDVPRAGKVALVGESGSGKTLTALSVMRLLPTYTRTKISGSVVFLDRDLLELKEREMRCVRGNHIAMVFQEPATALNPVLKVGYQITETLHAHRRISKTKARDRAVELLHMVGIPGPEQCFDYYPHQLSGGMRQRVVIAIAMSCSPSLIIADEPTTALDASVEALILDLFDFAREENGMATLLITHDLGLAATYSHHVVVMYAGQVVESSSTVALLANPLHPYTRALFLSLPSLADCSVRRRDRLSTIDGRVVDLSNRPRGCLFADRCQDIMALCRDEEPPWFEVERGRGARCWLHGGAAEK